MKIKSISMTNVRNLANKDITPGRLVAFVGPNGSGKSSCLSGIRYGLTGKIDAVPFIRSGEKRATVEITLENGSTISRTKTEKSSTVKMDGKATTAKSVDEYLGGQPDALKILTSQKALDSINAGGFAEFLVETGIVNVSVSHQKMFSLLSLSIEAQRGLSMLLPDPFTFDEIEDVYKNFYESRKAHSAQLKMLPTAWTEPVPTASISQLEQKRRAIETAMAERKVYEQKLILFEETKKKILAAQEQLAEVESQIKSGKVNKPDENQRKSLEKAKASLEEAVSKDIALMSTIMSNILMQEKTLQKLSVPEGECRTCPLCDKVVCTTDTTDLEKETKELLAQNQKAKEELFLSIQEKSKKKATIEEKIKQHEEEVRKYAAYLALHDKRKILLASIPPTPTAPTAPKDIDPSEAAEINKELMAAMRYENFMAAQAQITELQEKIAIESEILKALEPKSGIREKVLEFVITPFIVAVNKKASLLRKGFSLRMEVREGVHFFVTPGQGKVEVPLEAASTGEKVFALFLVGDMVNSISKHKIMLIDDLNHLDHKALEEFASLLAAATDYDHVFVATAAGPTAEGILQNAGFELI